MGHEMKSPVIVAPTIAATDAPCSAVSVIYSEHGVFQRYLVLPKNPDCVLVDTTLVANAPVELLVSGMGDAWPLIGKRTRAPKAANRTLLPGRARPPYLHLRWLDYAMTRCWNMAFRPNWLWKENP